MNIRDFFCLFIGAFNCFSCNECGDLYDDDFCVMVPVIDPIKTEYGGLVTYNKFD